MYFSVEGSLNKDSSRRSAVGARISCRQRGGDTVQRASKCSTAHSMCTTLVLTCLSVHSATLKAHWRCKHYDARLQHTRALQPQPPCSMPRSAIHHDIKGCGACVTSTSFMPTDLGHHRSILSQHTCRLLASRSSRLPHCLLCFTPYAPDTLN